MIRVVLSVSKEGDFKEIELSGHAMFSEYGKDIVCAAVSILTLNTLNSIEMFCNDEFEVVSDEEKGFVKASFKEELTKEADLLMKSFVLGLDGIENEYGKKYIKIIRQEV